MDLEDYNDDDIVCKYGRSDDLSRRLLEHKKTFKSIKSSKPLLKIYSYIDSNYASEAEKQIKNFFRGANKCIKYKDFDELIVIDKKFMKNTIEQYRLISTNYIGTQHDTIAAIKDIEYSNKIELVEKEYIIKQQNIQINTMKEKHKLELQNKEKEIEILQLKLTIATMNN
jgi:predicted GIY-YIG superfamily endonuclease